MIGGLWPNEMLLIAIVVIYCVGPIVWAAQLAPRSGRSAVGWGIAAAILGPIALLLLYSLSWNDLKQSATTKKHAPS
jgi:hypothetical protein